MVTAADIKFWTRLIVSDEDATRFSQAAEARLKVDGGKSITGELRTQLLCYLIGDMVAATTGEGTSTSETIGGYSYSTSSTSTTKTTWLEKYTALRKAVAGAAGTPTEDNGGIVTREDTDMMQLSRKYTSGGLF